MKYNLTVIKEGDKSFGLVVKLTQELNVYEWSSECKLGSKSLILYADLSSNNRKKFEKYFNIEDLLNSN